MSRASSWATIPRVSFLDSLQLIFHLVDACIDALLVEAGRTGEPDAHDHGGGVATPLAIVQRRLRDRQRDGIAQVLALNELRACRHCDGTGERDKCEAGCNHGRSSGFERTIALSVTAPWEFYSRPAPKMQRRAVLLLSARADRAAAECARHAACCPCRPPSATACDRRWCSTTRGLSSRHWDRRCARRGLWHRSRSDREC